ncbi:MAG TPA: hypothetical protein VK731_06755 [Candidatus Cybelea sp.]|jgi:hypothetical protein|nr:hypothetical protein [Candidatus Cybelea sp.]
MPKEAPMTKPPNVQRSSKHQAPTFAKANAAGQRRAKLEDHCGRSKTRIWRRTGKSAQYRFHLRPHSSPSVLFRPLGGMGRRERSKFQVSGSKRVGWSTFARLCPPFLGGGALAAAWSREGEDKGRSKRLNTDKYAYFEKIL